MQEAREHAGTGETKSQSARVMEARNQESEPSLSWASLGFVRGVVTQQCDTSPSQVPGDDR